jgi:hypothetical protein
MSLNRWPAVVVLASSLSLAGCGSDDGGGSRVDSTPWSPGIVFTTPRDARDDGYLDRRGPIHMHSVYSHDACDNMPVKDGVRDPVCFEDFRRDMCVARHDFIMLTDHPSDFSRNEYPDVLLYRADRGDELVERGGRPVASWAACPDGDPTLILAGTESFEVMPAGLEQHVADTVGERDDVYGSTSSEAAEELRDNGAVVLLAHTENWTPQELIDRDLDGFEMYNLHANLLLPGAFAKALQLLFRLDQGDPGLPHPDLVLLHVINEDPRYLSRWGSTLAGGVRRVTTLGTDAHRNTLPTLLQDGERVDSYRRLMLWFSNHLLIEPEDDGSWDDRHLKDALRKGRLYGAFEVFGYPVGFDYRAAVDDERLPMGSEVALGAAPRLQVDVPTVQNLAAEREPPLITARLLRAVDGGFEEIASGPGDLEVIAPQTGAYRAEVRIIPYHLRDELGSDADELLGRDYVWIYSNAIYVR